MATMWKNLETIRKQVQDGVKQVQDGVKAGVKEFGQVAIESVRDLQVRPGSLCFAQDLGAHVLCVLLRRTELLARKGSWGLMLPGACGWTICMGLFLNEPQCAKPHRRSEGHGQREEDGEEREAMRGGAQGGLQGCAWPHACLPSSIYDCRSFG